MKLSNLLKSLAPLRQEGCMDVDIRGVVHDSREARPGYLFVAVPGFKHDGHNFVADAAARGAVAAIVSKDVPVPTPLAKVLVSDSRKALALVAREFYGRPTDRMRLIGVTGTNGKTTTTFLIDHLLQSVGHKVGLIGTVKVRIGDSEFPVKHTTPEAADLQHFFSLMLQDNITHAVMEVSSHALALDRVWGCEFDVGVFTNISQDHLDLHQDMASYRAAKARLFTSLAIGNKPAKAAVINVDDPNAQFLREQCAVPVLTYGINTPADVQASALKFDPQGGEFWLRAYGDERLVRINTPGRFSVYNALAAIGVGLHEGLTLGRIVDVLAQVPGVPGRFEPVRVGQPFEVIVDYAHTPDGLKNIIETARGFCQGRVITVFGCGGDRDQAKRPQMGAIAGGLSDIVFITSDNPRSEDPLAIIEHIKKGIPERCGLKVLVEPDRAKAIEKAVAQAQTGDVVLIAGKGHETYQIFRNETVHFDDKEVAERAVEALRHGELDVKANS